MYETYTVDQSKLPQVWVTWASTKNKKFNKRYWLHCQSGTRKDTPEDWMFYEDEPVRKRYGTLGYCGARGQSCPSIWVDSGTKLTTTYIKWHDDIQKLEIAAVNIDASRKAEPRQWEYVGERLFVGKDKVFSYANCTHLDSTQIYKDHTASTPIDAMRYLRRLDLCLNWRDEVVKLTGETFTTIGGYKNDINSFYALEYWLTHRVKTFKASPKQTLIDELSAIELPSIETGSYGSGVHYSKVNENWSCLRLLDWHGKESKRIYFDEGKKVHAAVKVDDKWCDSMYPKYSYGRLINRTDACSQSGRAKHILEAIDESDNSPHILMLALRFPEIEQAMKLGVRMRTNLNTPFKDLEDRFGGYYNHKATNFLRKVGLTKAQLDILIAYETKYSTRYCYNNFSEPLGIMRVVFGTDLSPIDIATFKKHFDAFCSICTNCYTLRRLKFSIPGLDIPRFFKNLVRVNDRCNGNIYTVVDDVVSSYQRLLPENRPEINWYFDTSSEIARCHDAIDELWRAQQAEAARLRSLKDAERYAAEDKKRAKLDEKRKAFEFEDGDYIIRLPKSSAEIVAEGLVQHICIGSYTTRHATGETNLFFLRKKSDEETPFYAIQMNNDRHIVQIHGNCNKWLGNNPEAIPTVMRWLRTHDIKCDKHILTCKATGYGRISDCVALPVID